MYLSRRGSELSFEKSGMWRIFPVKGACFSEENEVLWESPA